MSPLRRPTGLCSLGKQSLFIDRSVYNKQIRSVGRVQIFILLKEIHRAITGI
jgi:hypothetical protein